MIQLANVTSAFPTKRNNTKDYNDLDSSLEPEAACVARMVTHAISTTSTHNSRFCNNVNIMRDTI